MTFTYHLNDRMTDCIVVLPCNVCYLGNSSDADVIVTWLCEHMDEVPSAPPTEEGEEGEEEEEEAQQEVTPTQPPKEAKPKPSAVPVDEIVDNDSDSDSDAAGDDGVDVTESHVGDTAGYKTPADFVTKSEYGSYVKDNVAVGMTVECCEAYEQIKVGDSGKVMKVSRDAQC